MATDTQVERRLTAVEQAISDLQRRLAEVSPSADWLAQVTGSFKDEPAFDAVLEYGRAIRSADRPSEDEDAQE
jgi:hypothetical protein